MTLKSFGVRNGSKNGLSVPRPLTSGRTRRADIFGADRKVADGPIAKVVASILTIRTAPCLAGIAAGDIGKLAFEGTGGGNSGSRKSARRPYSSRRVHVLLRREAWAGFAM